MPDDALKDLIESSDLSGLSKYVDAVCSRQDWDELVTVRDRCNEAVKRGKQVWGIAQFAEYRMALEAPPDVAASVIADGRGRFALGPLWEVAASTHTWDDLRDHVLVPTVRAMTAHERSIRGEAVDESEIDSQILGIPSEIQGWEPRYPVAEYRSDRAAFPDDIFDTKMEWIELPDPADVLPDDPVCDVLGDVVKAWWEDSLGKAEVVTVDGTIEEAIRSLGPHRVRAAEVDLKTAMEALVWAGASGGAHGRRRGTPVGRAAAWWVLLEILGYDEPPDDLARVGEEGAGLRWLLWDPGDRIGGWNLHLGVEDPEDGIAWVISAVDAA
ncbi:MAG: hypothetical protein BMS9Abin17_0711 [Acidimicrobiia bacterium]|nr:MAG: hypothetical protein BMS9Abin17_0711 [Acidimicrobiia bacterium]